MDEPAGHPVTEPLRPQGAKPRPRLPKLTPQEKRMVALGMMLSFAVMLLVMAWIALWYLRQVHQTVRDLDRTLEQGR